jgi:prolyl 4-hydroxylase
VGDLARDLSEEVQRAGRLLLGGPGILPEPEAATRIYQELASRGSGEAAARLATLAAVGVAREPDLEEALDRLVDAAELGHAGARGQINVLSGLEFDATGSGHPWRSMRERIDLAEWVRAAPARQVVRSPTIVLIEELATPQMCRWIVACAKNRLQPSTTVDTRDGRLVRDPNRTALFAGFGLLDIDVPMVIIQERLAKTTGLTLHQCEAPQVLSYEVGQLYRPHVDYFQPDAPGYQDTLLRIGQRIATCLTWLNEEYEGGETDFPRAKFRHKGRPGSAMLFMNVGADKKPDPMSLHGGLPVTRGRKWLLSQWVRDKLQPIV